MVKTLVLFHIFLLGSSLTVFGQQADRERPVRPAREQPGVQAPTSRPSVAVSRPAPAPRATSVGVPNQPAPSAGGTAAPIIPVQTYSHGATFSNADWYRLNSFLDRLWFQYRLLPSHEYQWRYAQGDSPLTPELLELALREPMSASASLAMLGDDLTRLIARYREGSLDAADFSSRLRETTRAMRNLSRTIRRDQFLNYLDLKPDRKVPSYSNPSNLDELLALSRELAETAHRIEAGITDFQEKDMTRVVSVKDLTDDSLDSLTRRVDRMSRIIERSGTRL